MRKLTVSLKGQWQPEQHQGIKGKAWRAWNSTEKEFGMPANPKFAQERRHRQSAIPPDLKNHLCEEQMSRLRHVENFGWRIAFVRRPLFKPSLTVMQHSDQPDRYAVLHDDGELELDPQLRLRT